MKSILSRRYFLESATMLGLTLASTSTHAGVIKLPLPGGPGERPITTQFPQKGELILQRVRPPPGMVLNQPALSKAQWKAEVNKMRMVYKAPIDAKDVDQIVDYLVSLKAGNSPHSRTGRYPLQDIEGPTESAHH
jgi:hypothetical protein